MFRKFHAERVAAAARRSRAFCACALAVLLPLSVAACAPEPTQEAGATNKTTDTTNPETEWASSDEVEATPQTELPETFPIEAFALPDEAVIYNAGDRGGEQWFLVLIAEDMAAAEALWHTIVTTNSFEVTDETETVEGGISATLTSATVQAQALTIPQEQDGVLLSFDLELLGI